MPAHELREGSLSGDGAQDDYPFSVPDTLFPIARDPDHADDLRPRRLEHPRVRASISSIPAEAEVASSTVHYPFDNRQQELGFFPTVAGNYTLRVRSFDGSGPYFLDFSVGRTGYARPKGATPSVIRLVPAFDSCGAPNGTHGAPLAVAVLLAPVAVLAIT